MENIYHMIETDRLVSAHAVEATEEAADIRRLRPARLAEYVGQEPIRRQMEIFIAAARGRHEALDHVLLFGPPASARPRWPISSPMKWA